MIKIKSQISRSDILNCITEEQIFKYYIPNFIELNRKFKSPFVDEKTPSCAIFNNTGRLFYKCFSSNNGGDCFNLVQKKYALTEYEALVVIATDFNIKVKDTIIKNSILLTKPLTNVFTPKELVKIRVKYKNWNTERLAYWQQYNIDIDQLIKYDIKPISHFWINGTRFHPKFAFAYNYSWFKEYTYKILQPFEEKQFKWVSNCPDSLLQGYNQLPKTGEILFITSSLKDIALLNKLGYNAIAANAEGIIPKQLVIDELKERFKQVICYLNNDLAGIKASKKYEKAYSLKWIVNPLTMPKDPSDLQKEGYDVKEIIESLIK